jgi:site-specific DNA-methyltransferase (adenine-specific)
MMKAGTKYADSDANMPDFSGDNRDQRGYAYWSVLWISEALRVTKPGGVMFIWTDWRQLPTVTDALQAGGWVWRGIVVWKKTTGRPMTGRFTLDTEFVVWGSNGSLPPQRDTYPSAVCVASPPRDREHVAQKPEAVARHLLSICPKGGTILDPFTGTGSTLGAAKSEGFRCIGIEIEERYCAIAARRCAQELLFGEVA